MVRNGSHHKDTKAPRLCTPARRRPRHGPRSTGGTPVERNRRRAGYSRDVGCQPSAISHQPSAVRHQLSAFSRQPSAFSLQPSAVSFIRKPNPDRRAAHYLEQPDTSKPQIRRGTTPPLAGARAGMRGRAGVAQQAGFTRGKTEFHHEGTKTRRLRATDEGA